MSLTGLQVNQSFRSLLNLPGVSILSTSLQTVQDGNGTSSPLQLSTLAVNITQNFSIAAVGIDPTGASNGQVLTFNSGLNKFEASDTNIDNFLIGGETF